MKSPRGIAVVAVCGAFTVGGVAVGQDADCNVNGIPDAAEIAAGLVGDCNGNGVPDSCEYATVALEAEINPFGSGNPLVVPIDAAPHAISDMRITVSVRADLDSVTEAVQARVGNTVVATLWITGGQSCPTEPQFQTVIVPMATVNASIDANGGDLIVALDAIGPVGVKECPSSFAAMAVEYIGDLLPADCLGNGTWDGCDIAADPSLDCDGNGLVDLCEIEGDPTLDCDGNGVLDACEVDCDGNGVNDACDIADDSLLDCDGNGQIDSCEIAADPSLDCTGNGLLNVCEIASNAVGLLCDPDCDGDGIHDVCQILGDLSLDKNGDGILDRCQYARADLTLDRKVDGADLAFMLGLWGTADPPIGDLTGDGMIDGADLAQLLGRWGETLLLPSCWATVMEFEPDPAVITSADWRERIMATGMPWRVRDNASQIEMLLVPAGTFEMGCLSSQSWGCDNDEFPIHTVTLTQAFYLGRYEVTQAQWVAVMAFNPSEFDSPSSEVPIDQVPSRPAEWVSIEMIREFAVATELRLPTEAEWEYACRAGTDTVYSNGGSSESDLAVIAWFNMTAAGQTRPVGQKPANPLGFHDMHGNVWEWVEDWYGDEYYSVSPAANPLNQTPSGFRLMRGGSWAFGGDRCRSSDRNPYNGGNSFVGFRVARTP